ncbi:MAG: anthranilate synthase component I [Oscillospiraceae bacterium]|nr:anthranilate synthase component I [Oscillospiraceae bacterium]
MMYPEIEDVIEYSEDYETVPVFFELLTDSLTPVRMFAILRENFDNCCILESVDNTNRWGRYSFIGIDPEKRIKVINKKAQIIEKDGTSTECDCSDPAAFFSRICEKRRSPKFAKYPVFTGGLIGYFGYDTVRYVEKKLVNIPEDDLGMPDMDLFVYNDVVAFDHLTNRAVIIMNTSCDEIQHRMEEKGISRKEAVTEICGEFKDRADKLGRLLHRYNPAQPKYNTGKPVVTSNCTKEEYCGMVENIKQHIYDGDISQAVISQRFEIDNPPDAFEVYRMLRSTNPSPYLYFFDHKEYAVAGASPEKLVSVVNGKVQNKPIAGTYPRGLNTDEDQRNEELLKKDIKETSEHTMLVDLGRNDVGRVCRPGSVKVTEFMRVERYSKVMHLVSDVEGILSPDKTPIHALMSVLPAGTLSGAPKVKAMEIIDSLEKQKRGLYGGTVGYLAYNGDIDTCIAIRTVLFRNSKAYIQAGAGIVYDSVPDKEYEESKAKAAAVVNAVMNAAE